MNKEMNPKEVYEAPAVLDITPVTVNVVVGTTGPEGEPQEFDDNPEVSG